MEKRNVMASAKSSNSNLKCGVENDELSLEDVLGEQASELPEKALMRHHGHHSSYYYQYDCCYPCYDYYYYPCYPSYGC
jgi:hypothetical protein